MRIIIGNGPKGDLAQEFLGPELYIKNYFFSNVGLTDSHDMSIDAYSIYPDPVCNMISYPFPIYIPISKLPIF